MTVSAGQALTITPCLKLFSPFSCAGYFWWQLRAERDEEKTGSEPVVDAGWLSQTSSSLVLMSCFLVVTVD